MESSVCGTRTRQGRWLVYVSFFAKAGMTAVNRRVRPSCNVARAHDCLLQTLALAGLLVQVIIIQHLELALLLHAAIQ